jgi:hypothetical protein
MDDAQLQTYHEGLATCPACPAGLGGTLTVDGQGGGCVLVTCDACGHQWCECESEQDA